MPKKGEKLSAETKRKIREHHARPWLGKTRPLSQETKDKIRVAHLGKKQTASHNANISRALKGKYVGALHPNWKGGITPIRKKMYFSTEYKLWRKAVFERDSYTCVWCGVHGGRLNADHIKPWAYFPELRFAIDNGRTLCEPCHRKTDTWGHHRNL